MRLINHYYIQVYPGYIQVYTGHASLCLTPFQACSVVPFRTWLTRGFLNHETKRIQALCCIGIIVLYT